MSEHLLTAAHVVENGIRGGVEGQSERAGLSEVVDEMKPLLNVTVPETTVLQFHLLPGLPLLAIESSLVRMNLVLNASQSLAGRRGGVRVSTGWAEAGGASASPGDTDGQSFVCLEVADNGCGIDESVLGRILDAFNSTRSDGHGLGLASVLRIVDGHGGSVRVESQPGRGTIVRALFPAATLEEPIQLDAGSESWFCWSAAGMPGVYAS